MHRLIQTLRRQSRFVLMRARIGVSLRDVEAHNPILVYQMGKVGSSTVVEALHDLNACAPVFHVHTLSRSHLQWALRRHRECVPGALPEHLVVSERLIRKLERGIFPCRIITLTREPISRAISFVFEDLRKQAADAILADGTIDRGRLLVAIDRLLKSRNGTADPGEWFDRELRHVFGVDVFSQPHDFERGYTVLRKGSVSVLVMRLEDLDRHLARALGDFLGIDTTGVNLRSANVGQGKWYAEDLAWVKQHLKISRDTLDELTSTRYFEHFYSAQRDELIARWSCE